MPTFLSAHGCPSSLATRTGSRPPATRTDGDVTVLVTGSAPDEELEAVAGAVRPYSG